MITKENEKIYIYIRQGPGFAETHSYISLNFYINMMAKIHVFSWQQGKLKKIRKEMS